MYIKQAYSHKLLLHKNNKRLSFSGERYDLFRHTMWPAAPSIPFKQCTKEPYWYGVKQVHWYIGSICLGTNKHFHSLVPRPRPAFCHLRYGKAGRAWYLLKRAWCNRQMEENWTKNKISCIVQPTTTHSTIGMYDSHPPLAGYVFLLFWAPVHPCSISLIIFSTLDVTIARKIPDPPCSLCN